MDTRQSSPSPITATGSPRSQPDGSPHTPGPWTVAEYPNSSDILGPKDEWIAEVYIQGNAQLFVAAPDLLAACELVAQHFARNHASGNFQGDDEHEAWSAIRAAITKAEGR